MNGAVEQLKTSALTIGPDANSRVVSQAPFACGGTSERTYPSFRSVCNK
jgi:hypothetical protein